MLVVMEGLDGCGKGTQIEMLCKALGCKVFKYPTRKFGMLNDYLEKKVQLDQRSLFLLFLADIMNEQEEVRMAMNEGKTVVLDRYVFSTIAYEKDGISFAQAKKIVGELGFIVPDKVVLFDIPASVSQERKRKQKQLDRYEEDAKYLGKVRDAFQKLHEERFLTRNWHKIDATKSLEDVHAQLLRILK